MQLDHRHSPFDFRGEAIGIVAICGLRGSAGWGRDFRSREVSYGDSNFYILVRGPHNSARQSDVPSSGSRSLSLYRNLPSKSSQFGTLRPTVVDSNQGNWSAVRPDRVERSVQADDHGHSTGALPACRGFKGHCDLLPLPCGCHWPATPTQSNSTPQCVSLHVTPLLVYLPARILL